MKDTLQRLIEFTKNCRPDMHEPDEQQIGATIIGNHLDNAMGDVLIPKLVKSGSHEYLVALHDSFGDTEFFNLATLIALARKAKL